VLASGAGPGWARGLASANEAVTRGSSADGKHAVALFVRACEGDEPLGCYNAGHLYRAGRHVLRDDAQARCFIWRACLLKDQASSHSYAEMLAAGSNGPRDVRQALDLFMRSCSAGYARPALRRTACERRAADPGSAFLRNGRARAANRVACTKSVGNHSAFVTRPRRGQF
jgi:TPR repeat protein